MRADHLVLAPAEADERRGGVEAGVVPPVNRHVVVAEGVVAGLVVEGGDDHVGQRLVDRVAGRRGDVQGQDERRVERLDDHLRVRIDRRGAVAEASAGERRPDLVGVGAAGQGDVGLQDRVAGLQKRRVRWLELHPVEDQLHRQQVARGAGRVPLVEVRIEAVLVDQEPGHVPEGRGPDLTGVVHLVVGEPAVEPAEGQGVDRHIVAVRIPADAPAGGRLAEDVSAGRRGGVLGIGRLHVEHHAEPVAPALAHATALQGEQGAGVARAAGQAVRDAVAEFVDHDLAVQRAVAARRGEVEQVHLHPAGVAVRRGREVRVVGAGTILGIGLDRVVAQALAAVVGLLEVAGRLVEPVVEENVVDDVGQVEQVRRRGGGVALGAWDRFRGKSKFRPLPPSGRTPPMLLASASS